MSVFVDTSAFYAYLDIRDRRHERVGVVLADAVRSERLVTHSYVVLETTVLLQRRAGLEAVRRFHVDVLPTCTVVFVDSVLHDDALGLLLTAGRRGLSLVDCVSFELMRRSGVSVALAIDRDFADQGFTVLP